MANILVVDDEQGIRVSLREFLRDADHEVGVAEDADKAMTMLTVEDFDVVVTDIILPRLTGLDLLKAIKEASPHVQVILMTGEPTVETAAEGVREGACDYLAKPIGKEQLLKTVANAARIKTLDDERRRLEQENRRHRENLERLVEERTAALRESQQRMELALAGGDLGTWDWDVRTGKLTFNERTAAMLGCTLNDIEPRRSTWEKLVHSDDMPGVKKVLSAHFEGKTDFYESEHRLRHKSGEWVWVLDKGRVIERDFDGKPLRVCGTHLDITDRRRAEQLLRQREMEVIHAGRLSLVGEMAASILHEIAQPVYAIGNYAVACQTLIEQAGDGTTGKVLSYISSISENVERTKAILAEMGKLCRRGDPIPATVLVNDLIADILRMLEFKTRKSRVTVQFESERQIRVFVNDVQIQQVFANLIRNACDAFEEAVVDDARLVIRTEVQDGTCQVSFEDNGPGLKPEMAEQVFESFFTTKQSGMGLGLAISRTIVKAYGGRIWVDPNADRGVTFHMTLPLSMEEE